MADPVELRDELDAALDGAAKAAADYLRGLAGDPVAPDGAEAILDDFGGRLPEDGDGAVEALTELAELGRASATRSSGPRFFHFVIGGGTPAALGADWLTSAYDQVAFGWASSRSGCGSKRSP